MSGVSGVSGVTDGGLQSGQDVVDLGNKGADLRDELDYPLWQQHDPVQPRRRRPLRRGEARKVAHDGQGLAHRPLGDRARRLLGRRPGGRRNRGRRRSGAAGLRPQKRLHELLRVLRLVREERGDHLLKQGLQLLGDVPSRRYSFGSLFIRFVIRSVLVKVFLSCPEAKLNDFQHSGLA